MDNFQALSRRAIKDFFNTYWLRFREYIPFDDRIIHSFSWGFIGTVAFNFFGLIASICVARILEIESYGEYAIIQNTIGLFSILAGFGLGLTATKYIAEYKETNPEKSIEIINFSIGLAILVGILLSLIYAIISPYIAENLFLKPVLTVPMQLSAGLLFLNALSGTQSGILAGFSSFNKIAQLNIISGVVTIPCTIILAYFFNLNGAILAAEIILIINVLVGYRYIKQVSGIPSLTININTIKSKIRLIKDFSLPNIVSNLICGFSFWFTSLLLVQQPMGYSEIAIYNAAYQWRTLLIFIPGIIGQISLPILAESFGGEKYDDIVPYLKKSMLIISILSISILTVFSLFSGTIMSIYGPAFSDGWLVLIIVSITACVYAILLPISNVIVASGNMWIGALMNAGWAIILIVSAVYLVKYGAIGLAIAFLIAYIFHFIWTLGYARYIIKYKNAVG
jgi:O-antigen/teichoic acid export membrane protein